MESSPTRTDAVTYAFQMMRALLALKRAPQAGRLTKKVLAHGFSEMRISFRLFLQITFEFRKHLDPVQLQGCAAR